MGGSGRGEDLALQVSGVEMLEVTAPLQQTVPAPEGNQGTVTEEERQQEGPAALLEAEVTAPPEKERLQPVYTDDLSDGAVTGAKIAPRTIDGSRLKHGIIGTPWLQDYAVQSINLADRAVTSSKIAPESVTGEHLAESSVSGGKLLDHSIGGEKLKDGSVGPEKLADRMISGGHIADGAISSRHLSEFIITAEPAG